MRWRTRGLLTSATAHRWLGRLAMVAFVAAVVAEARDPAHRPALQQAREAVMGAVMGPGPGPGLVERVLGPGTGETAAELARHGSAGAVGKRSALWEWLYVLC